MLAKLSASATLLAMGQMSHTSQDDMGRWRQRMHEIIFEADTPQGKCFDVVLLIAIMLSVLVVILESVESIDKEYHGSLLMAEWLFTILFTIEYILRLVCVHNKLNYARSFFGIVDLLAIIPTYLTLFELGTRYAVVIRIVRLLRVFRIFKLAQFLSEAGAFRHAIYASRAKITVFLTAVLIVICIVGATMHLIEGPESGFTSIPQGIYWAIVTVTTVGYGDISPITPFGKMVAAIVMMLGYSILLVPSGIISAEWIQMRHQQISTQVCPDCSREGHDLDAMYCKFCGASL